jgi:FkbM family methyltransferase
MEEDFIIANIIIRHLIQGDLGIIDAGSHEGDFVRHIMGHIEDYHRAIMIEPLPDKFEFIKSSFPGAKIFNCAISSEEKTAEMFVTVNFPKCSALYDRQAYDQISILNERNKIEVNLRRLDSILNESNFESLETNQWYLKVDTEGFEFETIKSLGRYLSSGKIVAGQFEYGGCWKERQVKLDDMIDLLASAGFIAYRALIQNESLQLMTVQKEADRYEHTNIYFLNKQLSDKAIGIK